MKYHFRNAFLPDDGCKIAEFDYAQAEAMVVSWLAGDEQAKAAFREGKDTHSLVATMLFDVSYEWMIENKKKDKKAKLYRQTSKPVKHGVNYGMGPKILYINMLKQDLPYTYSDAKKLLGTMKRKSPAITAWHISIQNKLRTTRQLTTPFGYTRTFQGLLTDSVFRDAYAFIPQSTVGYMLNKAWLEIYKKLGNEVDILLNVYDSLVMQYKERPKQDELDLLHAVQDLMLIPITIKGEELIIPVDCKVGTRLGSLEDLKL